MGGVLCDNAEPELPLAHCVGTDEVELSKPRQSGAGVALPTQYSWRMASGSPVCREYVSIVRAAIEPRYSRIPPVMLSRGPKNTPAGLLSGGRKDARNPSIGMMASVLGT